MPEALRGENIFYVVDDYPPIIGSIEAIVVDQLQIGQDQFASARTIQEAKGFLDVSPRRLIKAFFLNVGLPDGNGLDLLSWIKQQPYYRNTPVVIVTGFVNPELQRECRNIGADSVLTKPFDHESLKVALDTALHQPSAYD